MKLKTSLLLVFFALSSLSFAHAASLEQRFEDLRDSAEDYSPIGAICEQVARLDLIEKYPESKYEVVTGVVYGNKSQTIGELDVVVFDKSNGKAHLIAEVKCMRDFARAIKKARDQRERFLKTIAQMPSGIRFYKKSKVYQPTQFAEARDFIAIAQLGAEAYGFEIDLDYDLNQLMQLRKQLMSCQDDGRCKRAF